MQNIQQLFANIKARNSMLSPELLNLKGALEEQYDRNRFAGGVINPGYFSYLYPILDAAIGNRIISQYHMTQEQYDNYGNMIEIPIVDVRIDVNNYRLFLISKSMARDLNIENLLR
jgi:hypothetical protein